MFTKLLGLLNPKKPAPPPNSQDALQKLQETEEMLLKKQAHLEKKIAAEVEAAKSHGTKNKRLALQALKRKKGHEQQLEHIEGVLTTIQNQKSSLENASMNSAVLNVVGNAARALKSAHNSMDIDKVHGLMEHISEQQEVANEIATAISNPVGLQTDADDDSLLRELEEMEAESLSKQLLEVGLGRPLAFKDTSSPTAQVQQPSVVREPPALEMAPPVAQPVVHAPAPVAEALLVPTSRPAAAAQETTVASSVKQKSSVSSAPLPAVEKSAEEKSKADDEDEDELAELTAWMNS